MQVPVKNITVSGLPWRGFAFSYNAFLTQTATLTWMVCLEDRGELSIIFNTMLNVVYHHWHQLLTDLGY